MAEEGARFRSILVLAVVVAVAADYLENPKFSAPITNVTVPVGREAILACLVEDLGGYKVAWLRVDTQTILTIHSHVITKNHRIGVTHSEHKTWYLHIKVVRESDRGWYMCQINTDPMKSQIGYLDVVVPPDILDYPTSTDMVVREGSNVNLRCVANGSPEPSINWRRETGEPLKLLTGEEVPSVDGPVLNISRVSRQQMGPYLCIASNGIPPSVSKRIMLIVHFPPMIWIQNQLVGAYEGQQITLECHSEAFPKSINYWTTDKGEIVPQSGKYEPSYSTNGYKIHMKLTIRSITPQDYGNYKCVSKNSLGDTDGTIQVFAIPKPSKLSNGLSRKGKLKKKPNDVIGELENIADGLDDQPDSLFQEEEYGSGERAKTGLIFVAFLVALPLVLQ
ncbi:neurotrimin isoform X1 [Tribolium castaneum]|uniref:Lachesin-like Protein n=1 Tax=Tribolium castaneum TaxID=7070 RepID=D6W8U0_TRICA|nr:PREDICTED: neurotrimin isoform X1 [Tribolium castaneum]EEZ98398.2 Lachesin-like Protein [Tribolium castaneum]|eukprot:XP_008201405.1 PREDICTED: neurotrimin isoform X1 [Tribolium castaneum]